MTTRMPTSEKMAYLRSREELITKRIEDQGERVARATREMSREFDTAEKVETHSSWMLSTLKDLEGAIQQLRELKAQKEELDLMIELMEK